MSKSSISCSPLILSVIRIHKAVNQGPRIEVGAFYRTASAPEIVNSGREKQCSVSV